ncbi:MAG: ABC transporter ATP-binding protein [Lachnospiraceae bacterium]|nr:ABC transporter ATP-binding protein [Lachnospiraceae bacterium]
MPGPYSRRNMPARREKADFKALKKLVAYCRRYIVAIVIAMLLAAGGAIATIIGPEKVGDLMNTIVQGVISGVDMVAFVDICVTLIVIYAAGSLLSYGQQFIMATVTQYTGRRLRRDISMKLNKLPLSFFDTTTKGDILSTVTNDVDVIGQNLAASTANLISSLALFVGVIIKMFDTNWILTLITIATSLIGFIAMGIVLSKSQKYFIRKQQDLGDMNARIEEVYTNHRIVNIFGGLKTEKKMFEKINSDLYEDNWKSQVLSGMVMHIMGFVGNLSYVLIFVVGVSFILNGNDAVTLGTIMSFILYARLFSQPLNTLAQSMTAVQQASAASKRVFALLDAEELSDETEKTDPELSVKGDVVFDNIRFGYSKDREIIHGFSADLHAGQKVAIVGPTGAGKTTIVNLLMRFYELDSGDIKIDGVSVKDMTRTHVHDLFDMILQDTWLFGGTLRENLVYNKEGVTDEQLEKACEAVGLGHFVKTLPKGFDTVLSDSLNLSEGQKQQLTIARAMIKDSPLLILDEATSSVDTRTELIIQRAMDELTKGRTSFVIAHRLSTIKNADVILVLRDGDIVEQGSHEELLARNGFYAELYNSQFDTAKSSTLCPV